MQGTNSGIRTTQPSFEFTYKPGTLDDLVMFSLENIREFCHKQHLLPRDLIIIIAKLGHTIVGFVISTPNENGIISVSHLYVLPFFNHLTIESELLEASANYALNQHTCQRFLHKISLPHNEMHKLNYYRNAGWKISTMDGLSASLTVNAALSAEWFINIKPTQQYTFVLWQNLSEQQLKNVKHQHQSSPTGWYPEAFNPFSCEQYHRESSYALIKSSNSEVVGWIITEPIDEDNISIRNCFVDQSVQSVARVMLLWLKTFQTLKPSQFQTVHFYVSSEYPRMMNVVLKRILPILSHLHYIYYISQERGIT